MSLRCVRPASHAATVRAVAPPSKSETHRVLVAAALADGDSRIVRPLDSEDTRATVRGLRAAGVGCDVDEDAWVVRGTGGDVAGGGSADLGDSGTSCRFLAALTALGRAPTRLDGSPRLRQRPLGGLAVALRSLGARVELDPITAGLPGAFGGREPRGGVVAVSGASSSQFVSALLLVGSRLTGGLDVHVDGRLVSRPYVDLTVEILREFGVDVEAAGIGQWRVREGTPRGRTRVIHGDHSSASYLLLAAAITGGRITVGGLDPASSQPDARFASILEDAGLTVRRGRDEIEVTGAAVIREVDVDLSDAPDLAPSIAVLAAFASGPSRIRGVAHLRVKESDRLDLLADNVRRLGREARAGEDVLEIDRMPASGLRGATIETRSDHRIAMAFAVAGLRLAGIAVDDAECVAKSYPRFWDDLSAWES